MAPVRIYPALRSVTKYTDLYTRSGAMHWAMKCNEHIRALWRTDPSLFFDNLGAVCSRITLNFEREHVS